MKPLLLLCCVTLFAADFAFAQVSWEAFPNSPVSSIRFEDIEAVTPDTLFVIRFDGTLYHSSDAGAHWESLTVEDVAFRSLALANGQLGWVGTLSGSDRVLYETRDGGQTLTNISDRIIGNPPLALCGLFALDDEAIYGVGGVTGGSHFVRTLDGGATWTSTDMRAHASYLIDVYFFDRQRGIAAGAIEDGGDGESRVVVVLGTEDGGATWEERFRSTGSGKSGEWGWKISFPTPDVGFVSVENAGAVIKTTDGGMTWSELSVPAPSLQGVGFVTPLLGWTGGRSTPQVTTDGGLTWEPAPSLGESVNRFQFFGDTLGYAVAERVYRYRAGAPVANADPPALPERFEALPAYPNPFPERTLIPYFLPKPADVTLEAFDLAGRRVDVVERGIRPAGSDELLWWARDEAGRPLPNGVYLYRLRAGDATASGRVIKMGR